MIPLPCCFNPSYCNAARLAFLTCPMTASPYKPPTLLITRVGQLDAALLDDELQALLSGELLRILKLLKVGCLVSLPSDLPQPRLARIARYSGCL